MLLSQQADLSRAIEELIEDIEAGRKYMKTYKQMKMYNDPALNPVLYGQKKDSAASSAGCCGPRRWAMAMLPHPGADVGLSGLRVTVATRPVFKPFFEGLGVDFLDVDLKRRPPLPAGHVAAGGRGLAAGRGRRGRRTTCCAPGRSGCR